MGNRTVCTIILILCLFSSACYAQQDRATLTGRASDPSGSTLPRIQLNIENTATHAIYQSQTNAEGLFTVPNLPVGSYSLTFRGTGFKTLFRNGILLSAAQVVRIDVQMQLGAVSDSIEVTSESPLLQTDSPEVGTIMNRRDITGLPLSFSGGRDAENFAFKLTPGVGGDNYQTRINGSAAFSKAIVLDGADATIYIGGQIGESAPSLEALEEVKIQTSGMSAEYGRTGGGVFNFILRSGTNQIHGSAAGFLHNEWMDANSFANNYYGRPRQRDRRNDWGVSLGGPIRLPHLYNGKDKSFFYAAYERYRESYAGAGSPSVTVPLDEFWDGNLARLYAAPTQGAIYDPATTRTVNGQVLRDPFSGNQIPASRISTPARKLGALFREHYSPTVQGPGGQIPLLNNAFFPVSTQAGFTQNQFSLKLDHYLSAAHKLSGSLSYIDRPRTILDQGGVWDFNDPTGGPLSRARLQWVRTWYGRAAYDWTLSPSVLNHLQLGFNRQRNPSLSAHLGENGAAALGLAGFSKTYNYPEIQFGSNNYPVNYPTLGFLTNDFGAGQNFQVIDTIAWVHGRHTLRAGADFRRSYLRWRTDNGPASINFSQAQTGLPGYTQTGNGFASMLLGDASSAAVPMATPTGSRFTNFALFLQDDFRVSSTLTLNLGVRWDYQPLPVEQYNRLSNWNTAIVDPLWNLPGALEFASADRRTFAPNHHRDFAPRIGFAWQANPRTTLRGAYGIFYLARNGNGWSGVPWAQTAGFGQENRVSTTLDYQAAWNWNNPYPGAVRDLPQNASLANGAPGIWGIVSYDPNAGKNGYTQQWNFNIQRQIASGLVLDFGYVGSKSTAIQANELRRLNQLDPRHLTLGDDLGATVSSQATLPTSIAAAGGRYPFRDTGVRIPAWQTLLPYPQMLGTNEIKSAYAPLGFSTYHSFQIQASRRLSAGLTFTGNYTFSKSIDNVRSAFGDTWGGNSGRPLDYYNQSLDKSISDADRTHTFKMAVQYDLPFGRWVSSAPRWLDAVIGGWTVFYIGNYSSGWPLGISGSGTPNSNFATNRGYSQNPGGLPLKTGWDASQLDMGHISQPSTANRYVDTSLFVNPTAISRYQRGNTSYKLSHLRSPWQMSEDLALRKSFHPAESLRIQLRAEALNAFNRTLWGNINVSASSPLFGQVVGASDWFTPRKLQLGLRADW